MGDFDINEYFAKVKERAKDGDEAMQCELGKYYFDGLHCKKDYKEAFFWFEKSANQGDKEALGYLGECYLKGLGVEKDARKGLEMLEESAQWIDGLGAVIVLAHVYYEGSYGVKKDWNKAFDYFGIMEKRCIDNDEYDGLRAWKAEQDLKKSDDPQIMTSLARQYWLGEGVPKRKERALELYERASALGYIPAMTDIADCYFRHDGCECNHKKAVEWLERAGNAGDIRSMLTLAGYYENGKIVEKNLEKAFAWYSRASEAGSADGLAGLAMLYRRKGDYKKAVELLILATKDEDCADAFYPLGEMYEYGLGVEKNDEKAFGCYSDSYYNMSSKHGKHTCYKLGVMYFEGKGTQKDDEKAKKYLRISAGCGMACAKQKLKEYFGEE